MAIKFETLNDKILVLPEAVEEKTPAGIILPVNRQANTISTGVPVNSTPWKKVWYLTFAGHDIILDNVKYRILDKKDLLGKEE